MSLLADHLVGRAEELGSMDRVLDEVSAGRSATIELLGEPGIGKTRLLAELAARADARGWLVLPGSASELEQDLPFSVFVDALDEYLRGLDPSSLAALGDDVRAELAHVFPSLSAFAGGREVALQHERYRSHRALRELLEHLASSSPLLLALDDAHWADSASVELVGALLRRPPAAEVLTVIALRPRAAPERLSAALERAHRDDGSTRIELGALTLGEARELLGADVDRADAAVLYEESGGNPFYLEQLGRALARAGAPPPVDEAVLGGVAVPPAVLASLSEELAQLSNAGRLALEGASVAGDPFELELAAAAAELSEDSLLEAVDDLLSLDLLRPTEVPRRFRFRHPLVRRAVYEASAGGWRVRAHERCAEALAARGATAATRAHHVERSARVGDLAAVALLRQAGEEALRLAPATAAAWFADALRLLTPTGPAQERVQLLRSRAEALTATGRFADGHEALLQALELASDASPTLRARLIRDCAGVEILLGRQEEASDRLASAVEGLPDLDSSEAVELLIELAMTAVWRARYEEMQKTAGRAVAAARSLGDAPLTAAALAVLAFADMMLGEAGRADDERAEAAAIVDALSDDELARQLEAAAWLAGAELYLDRYAEAGAHAGRALALGRAKGQGELSLVLVQTLGAAWRRRGKLAESAELLDGGIEAARLLGNTHALVWNLSGRAAAALCMGDLELALASAQESVELSGTSAGSFHAAEAAVGLAATLLETGEPEQAVELLLESAGGEELTLIAGSSRAGCLELLTRCWLALDRSHEAERAAAHAGAWAAAVRTPMARAWADRAAAAVDLNAGEPTRAANRALAAAVLADEIGAPVEAALSRVLAGRALAEAGRGARAVEELQRAAASFEACGALRSRDEAERELGKLGHRRHRRSKPGASGATGLESLTARELEVARLVVDRRTNREIAVELFVSQKTVETHLRNIFRKLDVSSRVELARAVERADRAARAAS